MESNNAPAHDFAPAWLKLPAPIVTTKSANLANDKLVDQQRRFSRKEFIDSTTSNSITDLQQHQQQRTNYNNHDSSHYLNSRHYSFSGEQQYNVNGHSVANDINGTRFNKSKYIDQRSSYRERREYREKSTTPHHSNTKLSNRNNAELKSSYSTSKKVTNEKSLDYRDNNQSRKKLIVNEENRNVFNQEFPSLIDDVNSKNGSNSIDNSIVNSAWSNTAAKSKVLSTSKHKVQLIQRSVSNFDNIDGCVKTETNHIINNSKLVISTPIARNSMSIIGKAKQGVVKENSIYSNVFGQTTKILPVFARTSSQTTPAMEILVKNPKMRGNKSHFLKSMRNNESKDKDILPLDNEMINKLKKNVDSENETESNQSSFDISEMEAKRRNSDTISFEVNTSNDHFNDSLLYNQEEELDGNVDYGNMSSSLEAEHRFLMELGWKQDDDPAYAPLTEDEVKEFKDLINARNGYKRNAKINNQITHLNLSPKKTPPLTISGRPNDRISNIYDDDTTSSSEDDD